MILSDDEDDLIMEERVSRNMESQPSHKQTVLGRRS